MPDLPLRVPDLDRAVARVLTRRYILALGLVAVLTLMAQALVQFSLAHQEDDAALINLAGRQRMLSQQLAKSALVWQGTVEAAGRSQHEADIRRVLEAWRSAHAALETGTTLRHAGQANSPAAQAALAVARTPFTTMVTAAGSLAVDPSSLNRLLAAEPVFLAAMEQVVAIYDHEAAGRVRVLRLLEAGLAGLTLLVLVAEAVLVFRPAVSRIRLALADRERLIEREIENREFAAGARIARGIGMDLHDGLGQTLTALGLQAKLLANGLPPGPQRTQAETIVATATQAVTEARAAARGLAPVAIQVAGIGGALQELARNTTAAGTVCSAQVEDLPPIEADAAEHLYRIAQEAVANAQRHGHAHHIAITLAQAGPSAELRIADDGTWQPPAAEGGGLGLRSLRIRADRLGGVLSLIHPELGGTTVAVRFPIVAL
jgi:signal transduction histidine kinase